MVAAVKVHIPKEVAYGPEDVDPYTMYSDRYGNTVFMVTPTTGFALNENGTRSLLNLNGQPGNMGRLPFTRLPNGTTLTFEQGGA